MEPENSSWYSPEDWYSSNFQGPDIPEPPAEPAPRPKPKRRRTGLIIGLCVLCVLLLVAGSAILASALSWGKTEEPPLAALPSPSQTPEAPETPETPETRPGGDVFSDFSGLIPGFGDLIPGFGDGDNWASPDDDGSMPDNFQDFFSNYFTSEEKIESSNIPVTAPKGDFTLELRSCGDEDALSLQQLYADCASGVVGVKANMANNTGYGWGSGVVISKSGYIVTNAHVIANAESCTIVLSDGSEHEALLVGEDTLTDLAVLKVDVKAAKLHPAVFGDSDELTVGDDVVAIGNPLGAQFSGTLTNGIVSAINRNVDYSGTSMTLIQTNTALNEGNSGGPLYNMYGQVIGITNMKMSNEYGVTIEGIGFAIPSRTVKTVVDSIIAQGKVTGRPGIGITCGSVPEQAQKEYGLPEGLYITEVSEGSDAKAKGILPGDVLTHINGRSVLTTEDVLNIRDEHKVGDSLRFTIFRNGETFDVDVEIYDLGNIY